VKKGGDQGERQTSFWDLNISLKTSLDSEQRSDGEPVLREPSCDAVKLGPCFPDSRKTGGDNGPARVRLKKKCPLPGKSQVMQSKSKVDQGGKIPEGARND